MAAVMLLLVAACQKDSDSSSTDSTHDNTDTPPIDHQPLLITSKMNLWNQGTQLRGMNIGQVFIRPELDGTSRGNSAVGSPVTLAELKELRSYHANVVQLSFPGLFTVDAPHRLNQDVLKYLEDLLVLLQQADLFAVLSFRTGPGRSRFSFFWGSDTASDPVNGWFDPSYYNEDLWEDSDAGQLARKGFTDMWRFTANHFKGHPIIVGYDLLVEPNSNVTKANTFDNVLFYETYAGTTYDWNMLFPDLVDAIREIDSEIPIIIQPLSYSKIFWLPHMKVLSDPNIIYGIHQYEPKVYSHPVSESDVLSYPGNYDANYNGSPDNVNKAWLVSYLSSGTHFAQQHKLNIVVNEFGGKRIAKGIDRFISDQMDIYESRGWNHFLWDYSLRHEWENRGAFEKDFDFRFGPDANASGPVDNAFKDTVLRYWSKNKRFPSNTGFN